MIKLAIAVAAFSSLLAGCGGEPLPVLLSKTCSVDVPATGSVAERGRPLHVGGWAFDSVSGISHEKIVLQLVSDDQRTVKVVKATRGTKRPDVVKAYDAPGAESSLGCFRPYEGQQ